MHDLSARAQRDALARGELTPTELTRHYLDRIERLGRSLGAFITVTPDAALERAAQLEAARRSARLAPPLLWGLPLADKDLVQRAGVRTTFGSRLFADFVPEVSDTLARALDDAGAVSLGKTNTPEFGMPSYTENRVAEPARNPWNLTLGPGGSSGGAAVAVAAGLLPVAPGSDGGGSIRIPAAATGLVGIKPSRGLVPSGTALDGLGGLAVPGPLARTVADAAMLLDAMLFEGPLGGTYPFTVRAPRGWSSTLEAAAVVSGPGALDVAVVTTSPWSSSVDIEVEPEATAALELAVRELEGRGHRIHRLSPEWPTTYSEHFTTVWQSGASTIPAEGERLDLLEPLTRWLIEKGRAISARELALALRGFADFERSLIAQFAPYDAVLTPALALSPRELGWYSSDPVRNFEQQVQFTPFTSFVNVSGLPAITLPVVASSDGLPVAVQLIGRAGGEHTLVSLGAQLESACGWGDRHPPVWFD